MRRTACVPSLLCLVALTLWPSCRRERPPNANSTAASHQTSEGSFAVQAAAVRHGESDTIRLDETLVTDDDLVQLDGCQSKLRRINLSRTELTDQALVRLARCRQLEQLRIASSRFTDEGLRNLAELPELKHLHLLDAPFSSKAVPHILKLTNLSSLYLDGTRLSPGDMRVVVESLPNTHIHFDGGHHRDDVGADIHEK